MAPMKRPAKPHLTSEFSSSFSLSQVAHRWHLTRREVRRLLQHGKLPFQQVCGQIRIPQQAVLTFERHTPRAKATGR